MIKHRRGTRQQHEHDPSSRRWTACGATTWLLSATLCSALVSGCVSVEKYEAEKTRTLNFQRLLAQEEHRADELNAQLQEARIEVESLGSQKDELTLQLASMQDQGGTPRTATPSGSGTGESDYFPKTSLSELGLPDLSFEESLFQDFEGSDDGASTYHTVQAGDTLYRLSRNYGVTVGQLKAWNNLTDDTITIGQRLIIAR